MNTIQTIGALSVLISILYLAFEADKKNRKVAPYVITMIGVILILWGG